MDDRERDRLEDRRQVEHLLPVGFAFLLPYISYPTALLLGMLAVLYALYVSPRLLRVTTRAEELRRGFSMGKLTYALGVLGLLVLFREQMYIAAAAWGILAAGDAFSNLVGRRWKGRDLPYNPEKSLGGLLTFCVTATAAAWVLLGWNGAAQTGITATTMLAFSFLAAALAGLAESFPSVVDDNIAVCWVSSLTLYLLFSAQQGELLPPAGSWTTALAVNLGVLLLSRLVRWISGWGTVAGFVFGVLIFVAAGPVGYGLILSFLVLGSLTTRLGRQRKRAFGVEEANQGQRGLSNVLSNGLVPALLALAFFWVEGSWLKVAYCGAVATAAFDTVATEIGQWLGRSPVNPRTLRPVAVGTPGAVSLAGTAAGFGAALILAVLAWGFGWLPWLSIPIIVAGALAGAWFESLAGSFRPPGGGPVWDATLNFYNTLFGASASGLLWIAVRGT